MNFDKIIETQGAFFGVNDSEKGRVVIQKIAARNLLGISLNKEPLIIGIAWRENKNGQLVVLDKNASSIFIAEKIIKIFESKG